MNTQNFSRDDWIIGGITLLLIIDLLFLPWFSVSIGPFTFTTTATGDPDGWLGILAVIVAIALLADLAVERMSPQSQIPAIGGSRTQTRFVLACATALLLLLKFLFHINHFSDLGFGFWLALLLTAALVYVTLQVRSGTSINFGGPRAGVGGGSTGGGPTGGGPTGGGPAV